MENMGVSVALCACVRVCMHVCLSVHSMLPETTKVTMGGEEERNGIHMS